MEMDFRKAVLPVMCLLMMVACKKTGGNGGANGGNGTGGTGTVNQDTVGTLKSAANSGFPFGLAIEYGLFKQNQAYAAVVKREASVVTFGYQMKHGAIVKDDGSFDFSSADELLALCNNAGLEVYGHTLVWHQNQNGNYLRSLTVGNTQQVAIAIDSAMSRFIRASMMRYAGKVKAWDVVNEPMMDGNSGLRTNTGTTTGDAFYWSQYLGREYALKAFQYAKAADPNALLFINEYNLEYNPAKLDSLISYVNELKAQGAKIDGIGTQMHISINTPLSGIDNAFKKLAATGLKVRVSELDVRVNPNDVTGFVAGKTALEAQASMYKYVLNAYIQNVPQPQRYGFIVWGIADSDSWIITSQKKTDAPLLFDNSYGKKPAFYSLLSGFKGK